MTSDLNQAPVARTPLLPRTALGWWCVALGGIPLVLFVLIMLVLPLVGLILGDEEITIGFLDTWVTPAVMVMMLLASAGTGFAAHRRGERATASELTMWLSLAIGTPLAVFLIGGALSGA